MDQLQVEDVIKVYNALQLTLSTRILDQGLTLGCYELNNYNISIKVNYKVFPNNSAEITCYGKFVDKVHKCLDKIDYDVIVRVIDKRVDTKVVLGYGSWTVIHERVVHSNEAHPSIRLEVSCLPRKSLTLETIYEDDDLLDFKVIAKDEDNKNHVGFHQVVLSAWSQVFQKMFNEQWKENMSGEVELPYTIEVIEAFKKYLYTFELPTDRDSLISLIDLGSCYLIPRLETAAIQAIADASNPEELFETLEISMEKKLYKLTAAILNIMQGVDINSIFRNLNLINN